MKILEIIPIFDEGGAERFVIDLSNELSKLNGVEVFVISLFDNSTNGFLLKELNKEITFFQLGKKSGFDFTTLIKLFKLIKKINPDIVHSHLRAFEYLIPAMIMVKAIFIHTIHSNAYFECPNSLKRTLRNYFYKHGLSVPVTISKDSTESYIQAYKNKKNKEIINGRPIVKKTLMFDLVKKETELYKVSNETKLFINVARISMPKNQVMLVKVFNKLINEGYDISLIILGAKREIEIVKEIESIKHERIHLLGLKNNPIDYLYCADAFCLSSIHEGMPISLIEAFQVGCIPVCTPAGGIKNMIKNQYNGLISNDFTEASFEQTIKDFISLTKNERSVISNNCKKVFHKKYNISTTTDNYVTLFEELNSSKMT